eukprot:1493001-Pleurochrysis_carterae.AAC.2
MRDGSRHILFTVGDVKCTSTHNEVRVRRGAQRPRRRLDRETRGATPGRSGRAGERGSERGNSRIEAAGEVKRRARNSYSSLVLCACKTKENSLKA